MYIATIDSDKNGIKRCSVIHICKNYDSDTQFNIVTQYDNKFICRKMVDINNNRLIPNDIKHVDIKFKGTCKRLPLCFKSITIMVNDICIFPDSVESVTIDTYINGDKGNAKLTKNGKFVFGDNIKRIHFYGRVGQFSDQTLSDIYLWPTNKKYTHYMGDLTYAVKLAKYIYETIPLPIFEEFWAASKIMVNLPNDTDEYDKVGNSVL